MSKKVQITDVPPDKLDQVTQDFESEGATVTSALQSDGNYTVTATWA
jgi:hypothetical protein